MLALIWGLGIPAGIALAVTVAVGVLKLLLRAAEAVVDVIFHEQMMRPRERYFRMV